MDVPRKAIIGIASFIVLGAAYYGFRTLDWKTPEKPEQPEKPATDAETGGDSGHPDPGQGSFIKEFWWLYSFVVFPAMLALWWATYTPSPKGKQMTEREKRRLPRF